MITITEQAGNHLKGLVKDAIEMEPDDFISLQLYPIDSSYNDSTIYKKKPKRKRYRK